MKATVYNLQGELTGTMELPEKVFATPIKTDAVHQVVVAERAASRNPVAHTKRRDDVRGGGRKPWKQKGTGRARAGSIRSPLWRGGGVVFGPRSNRNFSKKINRSQFRSAMASVLSDKIASKSLFIIDKLDLSAVKTRQLTEAISGFRKKLKIESRKVNVVVPDSASMVVLSGRNVPYLNIIPVSKLSPLQLLQANITVVPQDVMSVIEKRYFKTR